MKPAEIDKAYVALGDLPEHYPEKLGLKLPDRCCIIVNGIELPEHYPEKLGLKRETTTKIPIARRLPEHYPEKLGLKLNNQSSISYIRLTSRALSRKIRIETNIWFGKIE